MLKELENNYAEANLLKDSREYIKFKKKILYRSNSIYDNDSCFISLNSIRYFLKDKHIFITQKGNSISKIDSVEEDYLVTQLKKNELSKSNKDGLKGLWIDSFSKTEYLIFQDKVRFPKSDYVAVIVSSENARLKRRYINLKFNGEGVIFKNGAGDYLYFKYKLKNNILNIYAKLKWIRKHTIIPHSYFNNNLSIKSIRNDVVLINIPFSSGSSQKFDSMLDANTAIIKSSPILIIDLRDNAGGSVNIYKRLKSLIYTNPIKNEDYYYYGSVGNLALLEKYRDGIKDTTSNSYKSYDTTIQNMKKSLGKLVYEKSTIYTQDSIYLHPKKVALLYNEFTASAAELFMLTSVQSKKVTLFSTTSSMGAVDKVDAFPKSIENCGYTITIPTSLRVSRIYKKDLDNIGFTPDVKISKKQDAYIQILKYYDK